MLASAQNAAIAASARGFYPMLFDTAKKSSNIAVSNGGRTAACSGGGVEGVMGVYPLQVEAVIDFRIDVRTYQDPYIGVAQADAGYGQPGQTTKSLAYRGIDGLIFYNHGSGGDFPAPSGAFVCAANDRITMEIDHDLRRFRLSQNKGTPTGWISYAMLTGTIYPLFGLDVGSQLTIL